jgi:hypothetical protein
MSPKGKFITGLLAVTSAAVIYNSNDQQDADTKDKRPFCLVDFDKKSEEFKRFLTDGKLAEADAVWSGCRLDGESGRVSAQLEQLFVAKQVAAVRNTSLAMDARVFALDLLQGRKADEVTLLLQLHPDVFAAQKKAEQESKALQAKADKQMAQQKRKEGVEIGFSKEDVLASSWGRPDQVNKTTNVYGTREQWVYRTRGRGYLYFEDDRLVSIQN